MMLRAPRFNHDQLEALRSLLQIDFARSVRESVLKSRKEPLEDTSEAISRQLKMSGKFQEADGPLMIGGVIMQIQGVEEIQMPLEDRWFEFYNTIITKVAPTTVDLSWVVAEKRESALADLNLKQEQLKQRFSNAVLIDRAQMENNFAKAPAGKPAKVLMN